MNEMDERIIDEMPDPETVRKIEELEAEGGNTPDAVLLGAMQDVGRLIEIGAEKAANWRTDNAELVEINRSVSEMASFMLRMYDRLEARQTVSLIDKLHMMRGVEERNEESIRKWSDKHEALCKAEDGNEGARCARHGHCAGAECE